MTPPLAACPLAERLTVRPLRGDLALVSVRLPDVNLSGMWAHRDDAGRIRLDPPRVMARNGRQYASYALQPGFAAQVADAVAVIWQRADDGAAG